MFLILTLVLGSIFLGVKVVEYAEKFTHHLVPGAHFQFHDAALKNGAEIYFSLYFGMTGLHATHMIFGGFVLVPLIVMADARQVLAGVVHADRAVRPLLALRRHRLDLPVPVAVSDVMTPTACRRSACGRRPSRRLRRHRGIRHQASGIPTMSHVAPKSQLYAVFAALMVLTVVTVLVSRVNLGYLNLPVAMAVAVTKALLVILIFMEVKYSPKLVQVTAAVGFLFLGILIFYTMTDYLSRNVLGVAGR